MPAHIAASLTLTSLGSSPRDRWNRRAYANRALSVHCDGRFCTHTFFRSGTALEAPEPVPAAQARVPSTSASPAPDAGARARSSSATAGKKNQKRKKIELTLPDSSDEEDDSGGDLRAKIARLEGENARLRGAVKAEPGVKIKEEPKIKKEKYKTSQENGKVVLDLLDE